MDFDFKNVENDNYIVDINHIISDETIYPIVKKFAIEYKSRGYITPGDYFSNVHLSDLEILRRLVDSFHTDKNIDDQQNLMLLAILMASAEGIDVCDEHIENFLKSIIILTTIEYLDRNNLAVAIRKNFTFDPDSNEEIVRII